MTEKKRYRSAVIGYGGLSNMGRHHAEQMIAAGFDFVAACDLNQQTMEQAKADFPGIRTFVRVEDLLAQSDIDLVTVITPHNTHAVLAGQILESGKHCILEKPMCIRADDAYSLVSKAKANGLMLSVFHNRRWDGWYLTLQDLIKRDILGDIFHVEMFKGGYNQPAKVWRSDKTISGGALYDWGAHYMDWLLGFMPGKITSVRGHVHNRVWHDFTNEDQIDSFIEFENGALAHVEFSSIARAGKAAIRILGTKGAVILTDLWTGEFKLYTEINGLPVETHLEKQKEEHESYYRNIADHLINGAELIVKPEQAARIIAVIETTEKSAAAGNAMKIIYEEAIGS